MTESESKLKFMCDIGLNKLISRVYVCQMK